MTNSRRDAASDGGSTEADSADNAENDGIDFDVDLPDDSVFDVEDYLRMYEVASRPKEYAILTILEDEDELSASELSKRVGEEGNGLHYRLRTLKNTGLIRNRRNPNTGTPETYSYYTLTEMAHIILSEGIRDGVRMLAREEAELNDKYGG